MITAGGTATAWHISKTIKNKFGNEFFTIVTDTNPSSLVAASTNADIFINVPPINSNGYYNEMLKLLESYEVDFLVPLIDKDVSLFYNDNPDLLKIGVTSTAPSKDTIEQLRNKHLEYKFCSEIGIPVPATYNIDSLNEGAFYFVKPDEGFGSRNSGVMTGKEIKEKFARDDNSFVFQEVCEHPEITVEIFSYNGQYSFVIRERIETKAGVSTKARFIVGDNEIEKYIDILHNALELPIAACIQFMKKGKTWCLTDFNLRMAAGSGMSTAAGWDLTSAFLATLLKKEDPFSYLKKPDKQKIILRVYEEIVTE